MDLEILDEMERLLYAMLDLAKRSAMEECGEEERRALQRQLAFLRTELDRLADRLNALDAALDTEELSPRYEDAVPPEEGTLESVEPGEASPGHYASPPPEDTAYTSGG